MRSKTEILNEITKRWDQSKDLPLYAQDVEDARLEVLIDIRDLIKTYLEIVCDIKGL